jgi:ATP-binding cassette subfamily C exporter for protease/lipase
MANLDVKQPKKSEKNPIAALLMQCRRSFYFAFFLTLLINLASVAPLIYMMNVFDRVLSSRSAVTLVSLTLLVVAIYIFWTALEWIRNKLMVRISLRIDWDVAANVFDASFRRYAVKKNVNVQQLLSDTVALRNFLTGKPLISVMDAPYAIVFIGIGWIIHPYLAYFVLGATIVMLLSLYATQKISTPLLKKANDANANANKFASESLRQAEPMMAMGMLESVRERWYQQHRTFLLHQVNASEASALTSGFANFLQKSMGSLQMALGAWLAINNLITGGMIIAAIMLISRATSPIYSLMADWQEIVASRQAYDRLNDLLKEDQQNEGKMELPAAIGQLTVEKAAAVPPGAKKPVLLNVDFSLNPGEALAVVGPSAAGKTSLVKLLVGVWAPAAGHVRLDGVEISDWDRAEIGPQLGYVPQEIEFFQGTVAQNIARLQEPDPERVVHAAKLIGMHETILAFPMGYDTRLGETGYALSGGQRQRIAIARAFYGLPKYIVMDEPNANLDELGEAVLVQAVEFLKQHGSTIIITTHRPRMVGAVDKLLVLRSGVQAGFGPAKEMLTAVRNLQVVSQAEQSDSEASGVTVTPGSNASI